MTTDKEILQENKMTAQVIKAIEIVAEMPTGWFKISPVLQSDPELDCVRFYMVKISHVHLDVLYNVTMAKISNNWYIKTGKDSWEILTGISFYRYLWFNEVKPKKSCGCGD